MTIHEFIEKHGLTMTAEPRDTNPNAGSNTWSKEASHWLCTIRKPGMVGKRDGLQTPFSQGAAYRRWQDRAPAWCRSLPAVPPYFAKETADERDARKVFTEPAPPDLASVLDCLASDAEGYDNSRDFEQWAGDYGYDTDSRKAERTYRVIAEQAKSLRYFLGDDAYRELMDAERL